MSSTRAPVIFIHGLRLHASSWQPWIERFQEAGYHAIAPPWPGEAETVEAARADGDAMAGTGIEDVVAAYAAVIAELESAPILIGHSFGGTIAQKLLGQGRGRAAVAIDPAAIAARSTRTSWWARPRVPRTAP